MIEAESAPPQAKMRAKLVADLVRGRHAGKPIRALPDRDVAEMAPAAKATAPSPASHDESTLFFNKGVASAKGFRPAFWTYRRKAKADISLVVPPQPPGPSLASPLEDPAKPQAHAGNAPADDTRARIDATATSFDSGEGEGAPAGDRMTAPQATASGQDGADTVVSLAPEGRLRDALASFMRRTVRPDPAPARPASASELPAESSQETGPNPARHDPAPLDEIAIARLLAPSNPDAHVSLPLPERPPVVEAKEAAAPEASTPSASTLAEPKEEKGESPLWPAALDENAVVELLAPDQSDAQAPAPLPAGPLAIEAREPDPSAPDSPTHGQETEERHEPISLDEAAIAELLSPAAKPDRIEAPSAPIDPAAERDGRVLNPLSPTKGVIPVDPDASRETAAVETKQGAAFPDDDRGAAETASARSAPGVAGDAMSSIDLRDYGPAALVEEPVGIDEPPASERPLDGERWQESEGDSATLTAPAEELAETSDADTAKEAMIESLGAAIESVLSERRYGSPQPTRHAGLASYRSAAPEAVTSSSLLDELGAARPVKTEEPPPPKRSGLLMGVLGIFAVAILLGYVFAKGDLGLDSLVRQVAQLVS